MDVITKLFKDIKEILSQTINEWLDDRAFKMSAALSFYSLISLAPILILITSIAGSVFGSEAASGQLVNAIKEYVGVDAANLIKNLILNAALPDNNTSTYIYTSIILLWASAGIFVELKDSLNLIWGVEVKKGKGIKLFFLSRIISFVLVISIGFLFILFIIAGTLIKIVGKFLLETVSFIDVLYWLDIATTFIVINILFIVMMKYLPNVKIEWKYILTGSFVSATLFSIGNALVGIYLTNTYYSSFYGAAGSLVVLLFWIYYSSLIFFFGAELTQVLRKFYSSKNLRISKNVFKYSKISDQIAKND
jgi:membrane protein